jgi:formylglycine-generating enzyme required for sulfatase activity
MNGAAYPRHAVIITSRVQDEQWRALRQRVSETLVIQPIAEPQIEAYLTAYLGAEQGQAVFNRLDARLRTLAQRPLLLYLMKEAALHGESLPGNRGELYARFVTRLLTRDTGERGLETRLPDRVKQQAAAHLAFEMHRRATLTCTRDEAVAIVAEPPVHGDEAITALLRHGLLIGDEQLRFPHQTLQEYFAAEALRAVAERERTSTGLQRVWHSARAAFTGKSQSLAALAEDDWWSEAVIQLAGLLEDPAWLARTVARKNPWLAWWCVEEGRAVDADTRAIIENRSIKLLKSERVSERLRAVQALAKIQSERVITPLLQAAADKEAEVSGTAISALLSMGEAVRAQAVALAQQPESPLHQGGLAYLSALVGQPLVYVPAGPFLMGSATTTTRAPDGDELPQHTVALPGYWIGRFPVMTAQFRDFAQASQYSKSDSRSPKGQDNHPVVNVTWDDAVAYCRWLSERSGLRVMLPSETEWEKAARGTDGRIYPWGNEPPDNTRCNFNYNEHGTTEVGRYSPRGDSPYGCADMAGNVWEWTRSVFKPYPYDPDDGREDLQLSDRRVLRGGAFIGSERYARCAYRSGGYPVSRNDLIGFRVVVVPF